MHVLILPSWYPETPDDVDGIFFRQQAQALQRAGLTVGVIAPQFRSMRGRPDTLFSSQYGFRQYVEQDVPTFVYQTMYFFPRMPPKLTTDKTGILLNRFFFASNIPYSKKEPFIF